MMHLNLLICRVSGLVTPCRVSSPSTEVGTSPVYLIDFDLKVAVGYLAASKMSGFLACSFIFSWPKSMLLMSTVMSSEPVLASRSRVTVPFDELNLPRHTDRPMWSASKLG